MYINMENHFAENVEEYLVKFDFVVEKLKKVATWIMDEASEPA